jgi:hypothetical protein
MMHKRYLQAGLVHVPSRCILSTGPGEGGFQRDVQRVGSFGCVHCVCGWIEGDREGKGVDHTDVRWFLWNAVMCVHFAFPSSFSYIYACLYDFVVKPVSLAFLLAKSSLRGMSSSSSS